MIKKIIGHRIEKKQNEKAADGENVKISYVASTDAIDRYGDVVSQNWELESYKRNSVILWNHDQMAPPIGRALSVDVVDGKLMIDVEFDMADPHAAMIARKAQAGFINAVSVGFQPIEMTPRSELPKDHKAYGPEGVFYQRSELLELSVVTVPANGQATAAIAAKSLSFTDLEGIFEKRSRLDSINRHIMQVKETEDSWFVEFAKAAAHSEPAEDEEVDVGWGSGGDASQEMGFDWLEEYAGADDEDSEEEKEKEEKAVSGADLPTAPKEEKHNPEDQDMSEIIGAILGDDDYDMLANAFAFVEKGDPSDMDAYKMMIARMRNDELPEDAAPDEGELVVYWDLIERSMRQLLEGDVNIPDEDKEAVYELLSGYYEKFEETPPEYNDSDDDNDADDNRGASDEDDEDSEDEQEKQFLTALIRAFT